MSANSNNNNQNDIDYQIMFTVMLTIIYCDPLRSGGLGCSTKANISNHSNCFLEK